MDHSKFVVPLLCASQRWPPSAVCRMVPLSPTAQPDCHAAPPTLDVPDWGVCFCASAAPPTLDAPDWAACCARIASSVEGWRDQTRYTIEATTRIPIAAAAIAQIGALERNPKSD